MDARTFIAAVALLATSFLLQSSLVAATTVAHVVGGSIGWTIPPNTSFYSDWSSGQTIAAGDSLVFNFPTGFHTVMEVTNSNFDSCSNQGGGSTIYKGPATVIVTSGTHYYICSIPHHCSAGMKLAITVASADVPRSVSTASPNVSRAAPAPNASVPETVPENGAAQMANIPALAATLMVDGPTASNLAPTAATISRIPAPEVM